MSIEESKSVITCDLEGRIETFNRGAEKMFGWGKDEVVGLKRVSLFSPGEVVLEHVGTWLSKAVELGAYETQTVFVRKDGTQFAAQFRITPTKNKAGEHIGYCGITRTLDVAPEQAMPKISLLTRMFKWLVVTRAPFLTAMLVPMLIGGAYVKAQGLATPFPWGAFSLVLVAGMLLHVAANVFNDYFDWTSGTDEANTEYFLPYSGGSRSVELGLITPKGLLALGIGALVAAGAIGVVLATWSGWGLLAFGLVGALSGYFYTAPPLRLVARKGLGELTIGLNFGPLVTAGTVYALTGTAGWQSYAIGVSVGLLTTAILWINEFPDAEGDAKTGKNHMVIVLGKEKARFGYLALLVSAFVVTIALVAGGIIPTASLVMLATIPIAVRATQILWKHYADRALVRANALTIQLQLVAGLLLAAGLAFG